MGSPLDEYQRMHESRRTPAEPAGGSEPAAPLWVDVGGWLESAIPPRPWVVPGHLMSGTVTLVAGPGGAGKSALTVGWATSLALGISIGDFCPRKPARVALYNVEDDKEEQQRRFSAALRQFGAAPASIGDRVIRCGPTGVGTLLQRDALLGEMINTAAFDALKAMIEAHRPDVLMLDPLVELHTAVENDNSALRLVIAHLREIARTYQIAVVVVHHTRKGAVAGEADDIRGGGAIVGAVRTAFTVMAMTAEEAEELGISAETRRRFIRLDSCKGNYAPPREAAWFELTDYELDNGEVVAAAVPWNRPQADPQTAEAVSDIEAELERGTAGGPYSPRLALDQPRSVAALMATMGIGTAPAQKRMLKALLAKGWTVQRFRDRDGDPRSGLRSPAGMPAARWLDGAS